MAFQGYFFKSVKSGQVFPHKYIVEDGYTNLPNAREEIKAYRDDNSRDLYRVTAVGTKSSFDVSLRPHLHLKDINTIQVWFNNAYSDPLQRRMTLEYWNMEDLRYKTADFYLADFKPPVEHITSNDIIFGNYDLSFVEY